MHLSLCFSFRKGAWSSAPSQVIQVTFHAAAECKALLSFNKVETNDSVSLTYILFAKTKLRPAEKHYQQQTPFSPNSASTRQTAPLWTGRCLAQSQFTGKTTKKGWLVLLIRPPRAECHHHNAESYKSSASAEVADRNVTWYVL